MWIWTKRIVICIPSAVTIFVSGIACIEACYDAMGWTHGDYVRPALWCAFWLFVLIVGVRGLRLAARAARIM